MCRRADPANSQSDEPRAVLHLAQLAQWVYAYESN